MPPHMQPLRGQTRRLIAAVTLPLAAMAIATVPSGSVRALEPGAAGQALGSSSQADTLTLITGDVVTVKTLADGQQTAEIDRPAGANGMVRVQQTAEDLYVLPDEALPLISHHELDPELFNVSDLIDMEYDDASTGELPLIATYRPRAGTPAPRGSEVTLELPSVDGAALETNKDRARSFWNAVTDPGSNTLKAGVDKLFLDGRVETSLKESVPQIGAPQAWSEGF